MAGTTLHAAARRRSSTGLWPTQGPSSSHAARTLHGRHPLRSSSNWPAWWASWPGGGGGGSVRAWCIADVLVQAPHGARQASVRLPPHRLRVPLVLALMPASVLLCRARKAAGRAAPQASRHTLLNANSSSGERGAPRLSPPPPSPRPAWHAPQTPNPLTALLQCDGVGAWGWQQPCGARLWSALRAVSFPAVPSLKAIRLRRQAPRPPSPPLPSPLAAHAPHSAWCRWQRQSCVAVSCGCAPELAF